jgi:hypothetical protein
MNLRRAVAGDIPELVNIKQSLAYSGPSAGGFLLGCDEAGYRARLHAGRIWVLDGTERIEGFAITLAPDALRASPLWRLREQLRWTSEQRPPLQDEVGYFDQLAVRRGLGPRAAVSLAFTALADLFEHSEHVVTTTVSAPVRNLAAVGLIERAGGQPVAELAETYPELGPLTSTLWWLSKTQAWKALRGKEQRLGHWLSAHSPAAQTVDETVTT